MTSYIGSSAGKVAEKDILYSEEFFQLGTSTDSKNKTLMWLKHRFHTGLTLWANNGIVTNKEKFWFYHDEILFARLKIS